MARPHSQPIAPWLARLNCFLTRFLTSKRRRAWVRESNERSAHAREEFTGFDAIHFHVGPGDIGVGADVYLTSLDGAANELRRMCARGIDNGFDFMTNKRAQILHVAKTTTTTLFARENKPTGKGSVVATTSHFNVSVLRQMREESAEWTLDTCLRWASID